MPETATGLVSTGAQNRSLLDQFLEKHANPSPIKYIRLQWLDYTSTPRVYVFLTDHFLGLLAERKSIGIAKGILGILQQDNFCPGLTATGEHKLQPILESLRVGARLGYATVQCEFRQQNGDEVATCPRTCLRRVVNHAKDRGLEFLIGFEIEVVFMHCDVVDGETRYKNVISQGHAYSTSRALQDDGMMRLLEKILDKLAASGIMIQKFHAESAESQYEFVLDPLPPLAAVDTLLAAREIIYATAAEFSMRATLLPKPRPQAAGTGSHVHISVTPFDVHQQFYAGVLDHMRAIVAFTYPHSCSYERVVDSSWAGGTWVSWGKQNRETPLRQIEGSHFEIKCVDGLANMYLALSAIIGAGLQGVIDSLPFKMRDCEVDPSTLSLDKREQLGIRHKLPKTIDEALTYLREDKSLEQILGHPVISTYLAIKVAEGKQFAKLEPDRRRNWLIERY